PPPSSRRSSPLTRRPRPSTRSPNPLPSTSCSTPAERRRSRRSTMSAIVRDDPTEHRYVIVVDGQGAGASYYELDEPRIAFTHTEVDDAHTGQGLGKRLVTGALADVEARGLAVVPLCPYVRKVI